MQSKNEKGADTDPVGSPRRRARLVEMMHEAPEFAGRIDFTEEEIIRFAATRLQIDTDPA